MDAVELAFGNINRWWNSLRQLVVLRKDAVTAISDSEISHLVTIREEVA